MVGDRANKCFTTKRDNLKRHYCFGRAGIEKGRVVATGSPDDHLSVAATIGEGDVLFSFEHARERRDS